jgi:putative transposase
MYRALREATITVAAHGERTAAERGEESTAFRIIHISIQDTHVHLIVEADNKRVLERSMKSFVASAAKHINAEYSAQHKLAVRRRGRVFRDRYHQEVIQSPRQARNTLAYVLNNWRKHREDRTRLSATWSVDPFSSGASFTGWKERADAIWHWKTRETYDPLVVYLPRTWLLREGWRKHGLISFHEVPSAAQLADA